MKQKSNKNRVRLVNRVDSVRSHTFENEFYNFKSDILTKEKVYFCLLWVMSVFKLMFKKAKTLLVPFIW